MMYAVKHSTIDIEFQNIRISYDALKLQVAESLT